MNGAAESRCLCCGARSRVLAWANWPESRLPPNTVAERLVVRKSARRLDLYADGKLAKPRSSCCYRSLHISYPDAADRSRAAARGLDPGGSVMIHGVSYPFFWGRETPPPL